LCPQIRKIIIKQKFILTILKLSDNIYNNNISKARIGNSRSFAGIYREPGKLETGYSETSNSPGSCCLNLLGLDVSPRYKGRWSSATERVGFVKIK